jgi:hypothetical protein
MRSRERVTAKLKDVNPLVVAVCQLLLAGALTYLAYSVWRAIHALRAAIRELRKDHRDGMMCLMALEHRLACLTGRHDLFAYNPKLFADKPNDAPARPPTVN